MRFLDSLYYKLFKIHDTPHRVAMGLGIGVCCGIMPSVGLLTSLFLAVLFRANRAAAILGSLATNTWLSIATFLLSVRLGSAIMGLDWHNVQRDSWAFLSQFRWANLFKLSLLRILIPVIIGYVIIALVLGLVAYLTALIILVKIKYANKS